MKLNQRSKISFICFFTLYCISFPTFYFASLRYDSFRFSPLLSISFRFKTKRHIMLQILYAFLLKFFASFCFLSYRLECLMEHLSILAEKLFGSNKRVIRCNRGRMDFHRSEIRIIAAVAFGISKHLF